MRNIGENRELCQIFWKSILLENDKLILKINIFFNLRILQQHILNLKNSYKPSKTP